MKIKKIISTILLILIIIFTSCQNAIKNNETIVQDEVLDTELNNTINKENLSVVIDTFHSKDNDTVKSINTKDDIIGYWVGDFNPSVRDESKNMYADEGLYWKRENKINLSIDEIIGNKIKGHSIVAGIYSAFEGTVLEAENEYTFEVKETGKNKYDGKFSFSIKKNSSALTGTWLAFNKIDIPKRVYELQKKVFKYDSNQMLEDGNIKFGDWNKTVKTKITDDEEREIFGDYYEKFATSTDIIYVLNASTVLLTKKDVENLKKGDLLIIRNSIYARHGYSFKNRPLRVFFDDQPWYIPVSVDIKKELTEIEKKNIKLLLNYEKNAEEYYNSFGRG